MSETTESEQSQESNDNQRLERLERRVELLEDRLDVDPKEAELEECATHVAGLSSFEYEGIEETSSGTVYVRFHADARVGHNSMGVVKQYFDDFSLSTTDDGDIELKASRPIRGGDGE